VPLRLHQTPGEFRDPTNGLALWHMIQTWAPATLLTAAVPMCHALSAHNGAPACARLPLQQLRIVQEFLCLAELEAPLGIFRVNVGLLALLLLDFIGGR